MRTTIVIEDTTTYSKEGGISVPLKKWMMKAEKQNLNGVFHPVLEVSGVTASWEDAITCIEAIHHETIKAMS